MLRTVLSRSQAGLGARGALEVVSMARGSVAAFSTTGTSFEKRGKAAEEQYFHKLEDVQIKQLSEKMHAKELKQLIKILPEDHNLSSETLHALLIWKHGEEA